MSAQVRAQQPRCLLPVVFQEHPSWNPFPQTRNTPVCGRARREQEQRPDVLLARALQELPEKGGNPEVKRSAKGL